MTQLWREMDGYGLLGKLRLNKKELHLFKYNLMGRANHLGNFATCTRE